MLEVGDCQAVHGLQELDNETRQHYSNASGAEALTQSDFATGDTKQLSYLMGGEKKYNLRVQLEQNVLRYSTECNGRNKIKDMLQIDMTEGRRRRKITRNNAKITCQWPSIAMCVGARRLVVASSASGPEGTGMSPGLALSWGSGP